MSALKVKATRSEVADFQGGVWAKAFFDLAIPLLDIFGRSVRIEGCKADRGSRQSACSQYWGAEVQSLGKERSWRSEIIGLLGFRENIGHVVSLVAPCV